MTGVELALVALLNTQQPAKTIRPESTTLATSPVSCTAYDKRDGIVPGAVAGFICVAVTATYLGVPVEAQVEGAFFRKRNGLVLCSLRGPVDLLNRRAYVAGCGLKYTINY